MELWKKNRWLPSGKCISNYRLRSVFLLLISFLLGCLISTFSQNISYYPKQEYNATNGDQNPTILPSEESKEDWTLRNELIVRKRLEEAESVWVQGLRKINISKITYPWSRLRLRTFWDYFYPSFDCPHVSQRVGKIGDGGKWICGLQHLQKKGEECVVYSYGISNEMSFEEEVLQQTNCSVYMYDHTIDVLNVTLVQQYPQRARFYSLGIGVRNTAVLRTLKTEMDRHQHNFIDILKMDVEGEEFSSLTQIKSDFPNGFPFSQLLVELHLRAFAPLPAAGLFKKFSTWWHMLETAGLRAFHSEVNFECPLKCVEYSFINIGVDNFLLHAATGSEYMEYNKTNLNGS